MLPCLRTCSPLPVPDQQLQTLSCDRHEASTQALFPERLLRSELLGLGFSCTPTHQPACCFAGAGICRGSRQQGSLRKDAPELQDATWQMGLC